MGMGMETHFNCSTDKSSENIILGVNSLKLWKDEGRIMSTKASRQEPEIER